MVRSECSFHSSSVRSSCLQGIHVLEGSMRVTCGSHDRVTVMCSGLFIPVQNRASILVICKNVRQQSSNRHMFSPSLRKNVLYLQGVGEELVKLGHLGGDGEIDGSVSD